MTTAVAHAVAATPLAASQSLLFQLEVRHAAAAAPPQEDARCAWYLIWHRAYAVPAMVADVPRTESNSSGGSTVFCFVAWQCPTPARLAQRERLAPDP